MAVAAPTCRSGAWSPPPRAAPKSDIGVLTIYEPSAPRTRRAPRRARRSTPPSGRPGRSPPVGFSTTGLFDCLSEQSNSPVVHARWPFRAYTAPARRLASRPSASAAQVFAHCLASCDIWVRQCAGMASALS